MGAAVVAAGWVMPGWLRCRTHRFTLRLVTGLGVLAALLHGLGLAGLWAPGVLRAVTGGLALAGAVRLTRMNSPLLRIPPWLVAALAIPVVLGFALTRLPDTDDDPRTYHFAAPEAYLHLHKIHAEPLNVNWHMPIAASMLFGAGWAWDDIEGAKLVNLVALVGLMLGTAALTSALAPGLAAAPQLAALLIGATGLGVGQVWQGKDDLVLAAHAGLAIWSAVTGRWAVAMLLLGFACSVKFTGGFVVVAILGIGGARMLRSGILPIPNLWPLLFLFVCPLSGWLLSSWMFLGNPVHPFLSSVFPEPGWGPAYQDALHHVMAVLTGAGELTFREALRGAWRGWGDPALGHPLLPVLGIAGIALVRTPARRSLGVTLIVGYALWLLTERNPRYLFPFAAILAAFGGATAAWLLDTRFRRLATPLLLAAALAVPVGTALRLGARDGVPLFTGRMSRDEYLARRFTTWDAVRRWTNENIPAASSVIFAGEERRLWFSPRIRSGFTVHEPLLWRWSNDADSADRMRIKARQAGAVAIVHNFMSAEYRALMRYPGPPWTDRQLGVYRDFSARWLRPVRVPERLDRDAGGFLVHRLDAAPPGTRWPVYHLAGTEGMAVEGWNAASRGQPHLAATAYRAVAARWSGVFAANSLLALAAEQEGDNAGIMGALAPAIAAGYVGVNAHGRYGGACLVAGRYREGLAAISRAWRLSHEDTLLVPYAFGLYLRAMARLKARQPARATSDLLVAACLAPEQPAIRRALAALSPGR